VSSIRVLLVDDDDFYREAIRCVLEQEGDIEVVGEAGNGFTAIDLTRRLRPQVVVTDIAHPGPDGLAVAREVSNHVHGVNVLVLSGYDGSDHIEQSWDAGARGFVVKDEELSVLTSAIKAVAGGATFLSPRLSLRPPTRATGRRTPDW
jgi:DNA-binding NarL/FixJ family response regulator